MTRRFDAGELPYGVFSSPGGESTPRVGVAVADQILDLTTLSADPVFAAETLNPFMARGVDFWRATRDQIRDAVERGVGKYLPASSATMRLPVDVADFVDFNSSLQHATNAGLIFRPGADPVRPNWRLMPVGYHGRSGTVVVSGTPITRPCGQISDDVSVVFGPTRQLDVEAEVGFVIGQGSRPGERVSTSDFAAHVFGVVLVLDWSARDMQSLESVPLGPFLGKSFGTTISEWVLPLDALEAARVVAPEQSPPPPEHLRVDGPAGYELRLEFELNGSVLSRPRFDAMYWTPSQQLAHLTSNGARLRVGDLFASGTVSDDAEFGSLLELSWNGSRPISLDDGSVRTFLQDDDEVVLSAAAVARDGSRRWLGEARGSVAPARQ